MTCLASCGSTLKVKWWFLDGREENALIRRKCRDKADPKSCEIVERLSLAAADGYYCMSPQDVEALLNYCKAPK